MLKLEIERRDGKLKALLHSVDSCCGGPVDEAQLRAFAAELLRFVDGQTISTALCFPWEPDGL